MKNKKSINKFKFYLYLIKDLIDHHVDIVSRQLQIIQLKLLELILVQFQIAMLQPFFILVK